MKRFTISFVLYVFICGASDEIHEVMLQYLTKKIEHWEFILPQRLKVVVLENNLVEFKRQYIYLLGKEKRLEPYIFWLTKILGHTKLTAEDRRCYQREFEYNYNRFVQLAVKEHGFKTYAKNRYMNECLRSLEDAQTVSIVATYNQWHPAFPDAMAGNVDAIDMMRSVFDEKTPPIVGMYWLYRICNADIPTILKKRRWNDLKEVYASVYDYADQFVSKSHSEKRAQLRAFLQKWQIESNNGIAGRVIIEN